MQVLSTELVRGHAAGHIASAAIIAQDAPEQAKKLLRIVQEYVNHAKVVAPEAVKEKVAAASLDPANSMADLMLLETWFCHPMNTMIEQSDGKF